MPRQWNVTGLYKAQRDRTRGRRMPGIAIQKPRLVPMALDGECDVCGCLLDSNIHRMHMEPPKEPRDGS